MWSFEVYATLRDEMAVFTFISSGEDSVCQIWSDGEHVRHPGDICLFGSVAAKKCSVDMFSLGEGQDGNIDIFEPSFTSMFVTPKIIVRFKQKSVQQSRSIFSSGTVNLEGITGNLWEKSLSKVKKSVISQNVRGNMSGTLRRILLINPMGKIKDVKKKSQTERGG